MATTRVLREIFQVYLSIPSVSYAEANWYGSLRGGIEFGDDDTKFFDGASRWGIKGESEVSEGLSAVYQFEHKISTKDASQSEGRLAYVGLSGGFGTLTLGQIWSASYNHAGVIRDFPNWYTSSDTSLRVGNALSYSLSTGTISMQIDAIMDEDIDTDQAIDQLEFGMTIGLGDIGKIGLGYTKKEDQLGEVEVVISPGTEAVPPTPAMHTHTTDDGETITVEEIEVSVDQQKDHLHLNTDKSAILQSGLALIAKDDDDYFLDDPCVPGQGGVQISDCITLTAYVSRTTKSESGPNEREVRITHEETYYTIDQVVSTEADPGTPAVPAKTEKQTKVKIPGTTESHISAEFGLGEVTAALGYSERETNDTSEKVKITFFGVHGGIGDTGLSWGAYARKIKNADDSEKDIWAIGLSKDLGGGASTYIDHENTDNDGKTVIALRVDF